MVQKILKDIIYGFLAGAMISIGCAVYLACQNKYVGAVMFSVALLTICYKGYNLYTGRIGFMVNSHSKDDFHGLLLGLLGNTLAMMAFGALIGLALPNLKETAINVVGAKLTQSFISALIRAIFCGILMYIAVSLYREKKTIVGIVFCIPVFILSGFEHSIADMGYFAVAGEWSLKGFGYIWTIILGNSIGAMLFPALKLIVKEKKNEQN
ncbi:MAG: formate/nitrite transporter family protein [Clostridia bacterium]|nr:formate/nitrite transporter family protein [Clostridia bacterium]